MEEDLKKLEQKYIQAGEYGFHLQKEGVKIVRAAEKGLEAVNFIKNEQKDPWDPDTQAWVKAANAFIPMEPPKNIGEINDYQLKLGVTMSTASTFLFETGRPEQNSNLSEAELQELDLFLEEFSLAFGGIGDLASMRRGAWQTFHSPADNALMAASHSMREILNKVISQGASNEAMEKGKADLAPSAKNKITVKERLKFLLFGSAGQAPAKDMVDLATKKCHEAYNRLKEVAHGSQGEKEEVRRYMRITEQALLTILRSWKLRLKDS